MHYYIDGYNVLFRLLRASDDLQAQRAKIIQEISNKAQFIGLDVTLVFDAQYQLGESTKSHFQNIEVLFTSAGETADEFIINELKTIRNPRDETVVTSDKKLAWRARRKAAHSETVEQFMEWLNRRYKNKVRQLKEHKKETLITRSSPVPAPKLVQETKPTDEAPPEDCIEYYNRVFEAEYLQLQASEKPKSKNKAKAPKRKTKKAPVKQPTVKDPRSDMERWLEIFENGTPST